MSQPEHSAHEDHRLHHWLLGISAGVGALSLTPYILPVFGIGKAEAAEGLMHVIGAPVNQTFGSGLAATLQGGLSHIPFIGEALTSTAPVSIFGVTVASGTLACLAASGFVGIGGALLANWMAKREDPNAPIHWSKWVRIAALATSALIVLPGVLGAVSVAITFLAGVFSSPATSATAINNTAMAMRDTLGATNAHVGAVGGLSSIISCLVSCGLGILPVSLAGMVSPASKPATGGAGQANLGTTVELVSSPPTHAGQLCRLGFRLHDVATGRALTPAEIETTHTKKLHTMIVDRTLSDYHHLHPTYDADSGLFVAEFTPRSSQPYSAWHDYTQANGAHITTSNALPAAMRAPTLHPTISVAPMAKAGGIVADTSGNAALKAGSGGMLHISLKDAAGKPVTGLEPIMGAMAHLVGFSADGQHFMHCHPVAATADGVDFHVEPAQAGPTKFFLQLRRNGQDVVIPFGLRVEPSKQFITREATRPAHTQHALA